MTHCYALVHSDSLPGDFGFFMTFDCFEKANQAKSRLELLEYAFKHQMPQMRTLIAQGLELSDLFAAIYGDFEEFYIEGFSNKYEIIECDTDDVTDLAEIERLVRLKLTADTPH